MKTPLNALVAVCLCGCVLVLGLTFDAFAGDSVKGKALYESLCSSCHGATGAGDGPVGAALPPEMKPRDLRDGKNKFATDDAKFIELLKKGGAGVGLNPLMPAQSQLSDEEMKNVIAYVHTLHKQ